MGCQASQGLADLLGGGEAEMADLIQLGDLGRLGRTLGHDERPDRLHVAVTGLGQPELAFAQRGAGGFDGVERVSLSLPAPLLAVRAVDLDYRHTGVA